MEISLSQNQLTEESIINCHHCGENCDDILEVFGYRFCCQGCVTVFELLSRNGLSQYYKFEKAPGISPVKLSKSRYAFLANTETASRLYSFENEQSAQIELVTPQIHCISCVWLLENLCRLKPAIQRSEVNFNQKSVRILFKKEECNLQDIAELLAELGYSVDFKLADLDKNQKNYNRSLISKIAVAGFSFGNIMLFSFPHYLGLNTNSDPQTTRFFSILNLILSIPLFFYAGNDYLKAALKVFSRGILSLDLPVFLGMFALFSQSCYEVLRQTGSGYFDSLAGLIFFLLLGRYFQEKTYDRLSFERDYKSFFPLWATVIDQDQETSISLDKVRSGNKLKIRSGELIPVDAILIQGQANIDYSFVTGESEGQKVAIGEQLFAGGRQNGSSLEILVSAEANHSYLTELWQNSTFKKNENHSLFSHKAGFLFTISISIIATTAAFWHLFLSPDISAIKVFTAVVIVACPCALALSAPLSFGFATRVLSKQNLFLKSSTAIELLAHIENIVFDKTGTLTTSAQQNVDFKGTPLTVQESLQVASLVLQSGHPISRQISLSLPLGSFKVTHFKETPALGVEGQVDGHSLRLGKASWLQAKSKGTALEINGRYRGSFIINHSFRKGLQNMLKKLKAKCFILSGDNNSEQQRLRELFPPGLIMNFNQSPQEKLESINSLKAQKKTLMLGDGLNDAGALQAATIGIAVADDIHSFFPACDAILKADSLAHLDKMLLFCQRTMKLIHCCFALSIIYNIVGLSFAVTGQLTPLLSAILMPLSSLSILILAASGIYFLKSITFQKEKFP
jgi:P-type Cu+ transporter